MEAQTYQVSQVNKYIFEFPSIGKAHLVKQVSFDEIDNGSGIYNLALGTVLENGVVDFEDSSNNGDLVKVFSTIVKCVKIFTDEFPESTIFFKGNTAQKTKVYNEVLRRHYDEFSSGFNIFGISNTNGYPTLQKFDRRKTYSGFYLKMKI